MTRTVTCTNYRYNSNGDCVGMCGEPARVVYEKDNPDKGPNQPKVIDFPRCPDHDSPIVRATAAEQGYRRNDIEQDAPPPRR